MKDKYYGRVTNVGDKGGTIRLKGQRPVPGGSYLEPGKSLTYPIDAEGAKWLFAQGAIPCNDSGRRNERGNKMVILGWETEVKSYDV